MGIRPHCQAILLAHFRALVKACVAPIAKARHLVVTGLDRHALAVPVGVSSYDSPVINPATLARDSPASL